MYSVPFFPAICVDVGAAADDVAIAGAEVDIAADDDIAELLALLELFDW